MSAPLLWAWSSLSLTLAESHSRYGSSGTRLRAQVLAIVWKSAKAWAPSSDWMYMNDLREQIPSLRLRSAALWLSSTSALSMKRRSSSSKLSR